MITLRPYQQAAIDKTYAYWAEGKGEHPIIVAPTGAGKSLILGQIVKDVVEAGDRILMLTHVKELIEQNAQELHALMPGADIGIYSAGLNQKNLHRQVTFAGIQSIWKRAFDIVPAPAVVIIDEAHMLPKNDETRYGSFIKDITQANSKVKILGLTATPYRLDSGLLYKGKDAIFDGVSYDIPVLDLVRDGWLAPVIARGGEKEIDLSNVHKRGGEYIESELAAAASDPELVRSVVDEICTLGEWRKSWLIFASGVDHANMLLEGFKTKGIACDIVTGETPSADRKRIVEDFKAGRLRCLVNVNVLTTGFNAPGTDLIALVRATMSTALYVQMVGRGTRVAAGKENCLVLDYGNNVLEHGPFDAVNPRNAGGGTGDGEAPAKKCPECNELVPTATRFCPGCQYEFPPPALNHGAKAYNGGIMSDQIEPEWIAVNDVTYRRHKKDGKPDSIMVTYHSDVLRVSEWLCPDHGGYAASRYHARMSALAATAMTTDDALDEAYDWITPSRIKVKPNGKFHEIVQLDYSQPEPTPRPEWMNEFEDGEIPF